MSLGGRNKGCVMDVFETFYRQQVARLERELKQAKTDDERESIERELAVYRAKVAEMEQVGGAE